MFLVLVAGVVGTSIGLVQAIDARKSEAEQRRLAEQRGKEAERHAAIALAVNEFLNNDLLATVAPEKQGRSVTMRQVLDTASERIAGRFPGNPLVEAAVRMTLGNTYRSLGDYRKAATHLKRTLELRQAELGEEHTDTLGAMAALAQIYEFEGRYEQAGLLYAKAIEARSRADGEEHPLTLDLMNNLANIYGLPPTCRRAGAGR